MKEIQEAREEGVKQYEEIMKKAGLPSLKEFEEEFECRVSASAIAFVMSVLLDRIGQAAGHIEIIFQPTRMADAMESKFHSENEKTELFQFYKEAISIVHEIHLAAYTNREKRLETIKQAYEFYTKKVKPTMQNFLEIQAKGWLKKEKADGSKNYFG